MRDPFIFIGRRNWLDRFRDRLASGPGAIWRISGPMGIGKSTLGRQMAGVCADQGRVQAWLDLQDFPYQTGTELLSALLLSIQGLGPDAAAGWISRVRGLLGERWHVIAKALEAAELVDPSGGLAAGGARLSGDLIRALLDRGRQGLDTEAALRPERLLLDLCAGLGAGLAAGPDARAPVLLVDTYEHALTDQARIQTTLDFGFPDGPRVAAARSCPAREWLPRLWQHLAEHGWRVVLLGRSIPGSLPGDALPRFDPDEVLAAAVTRPTLAARPSQERAALTGLLLQLSFGGNPLWLQVALNRIEELLTPDRDLNAIATDPALRDCLPARRRFGDDGLEGLDRARCKLTLLRRLLPDGAGLVGDAWQIALPRVLDDPICAELFADQAERATLLHRLNLAGLFRDGGERFRLHEEVRDLLLADARERGLLDRPETRAVHDRLWRLLNRRHLGGLPGDSLGRVLQDTVPPLTDADLNAITSALSGDGGQGWMLEAAYHRILSDPGLSEKGVDPWQFWDALGGSAALSLAEKWRMAVDLGSKSAWWVTGVLSLLTTEATKLVSLLGTETAGGLANDFRQGSAAAIMDVDYWRRRVAESGTSGDYLVLMEALAHAGADWGALIDSADALLGRFGTSSDTLARRHCAEAIYNKGVALGELGRAADAITAYDRLLTRDGESTETELRVWCAKALYNMGNTLGKLGRAAEAIAAYDLLIARDGESADPELRAQCAYALHNKGVTLGQLGRADDAIVVYDQLLARDGESAAPGLRVQCAKALVNKGTALGQLGRTENAIAAYDQLLARDGESAAPGLREQCTRALANGAELLLATGRTAEALPRLQAVRQRCGPADGLSAIMLFLEWLTGTGIGLPEVRAAIDGLAPGVEFSWGFDETRPLVARLPAGRRARAECLIAFFEDHRDPDRLNACLAACGEESNGQGEKGVSA